MESLDHRMRTFLLVFFLVLPHGATAGNPANPQRFVHNGGYMVDNDSGDLRYREQEPFIPASTLKILTSLVALESLGRQFRFETRFFLDKGNNLYVKGYGDPLLTSEVVLAIGRELASRGITKFNSLYLDDSSFNLPEQATKQQDSANPYDAPNGALSVNFNALPVKINTDGTINSGEPQTPLLPMMVKIGDGMVPGRYRLNINVFSQALQMDAQLQYTGELFTKQFAAAGITIMNGFKRKSTPAGIKPIYIHYGTSLEEIVRACLQYSNNYIANQLFLACGARYYGMPATWDKSRRAFKLFLAKVFGSAGTKINIVEGSGLSRGNRISPAELVMILNRFKPYRTLLKIDHNIYLKTGTLSDVFCYAGYIPLKGTPVSFAIMLNQQQNFRKNLLADLNAALLKGVSNRTGN
ncbi:MAG: D-alanyl-D-alanine carboxypeptidase/D-alanyl-D-alanine-endopeptidase [Desulforhopalus sp.]